MLALYGMLSPSLGLVADAVLTSLAEVAVEVVVLASPVCVLGEDAVLASLIWAVSVVDVIKSLEEPSVYRMLCRIARMSSVVYV